MSDLQIDMAVTVARIEQVVGLPTGSALREELILRLAFDAGRLREHLTPATRELLESVVHGR